MFPRVSMLRSFGFLARRGVTTSASRQLSEGTGVSRDAKEFVRMLKTDRMLVPLILAFSSVFGVAHYSIFHTKQVQPREYVGLPNLRQKGYEYSTFERPDELK